MLSPLCVYAQTGVVQGHCYLGGKQASTSGSLSSNYMNGIIPACTVTVYLTGTTNKATITKPDGTALANPFTANTATAVDPGGWIFRAAYDQGYDVVMSGGNSNPSCTTAPLCYTQPVTLVDVFPSQSFTPVSGVISINGIGGVYTFNGSGVSCTGTTCTFTGAVAGVTSLNSLTGILNLVGDSSLTVTPSGSNINLHATGTGGSGVQYSTDPILVTSFSGLYDDNDSNSRSLGIPSSVSCDGGSPTTTCTVAFGVAHNLSVGNAIDMSNLSTWPASPAGGVQQSAQYGSFQVATVPDSTHITFTTPARTPSLTYTCGPCTGTAYDASLWAIWRLAKEPYIYGHATVYGIETTTQAATTGLATWVAGMNPAPKILIDQTGHNDLVAGNTPAQVWTNHQLLYAAAHTAGMKVIQTSLIPAQFGLSPQASNVSQINEYFLTNQSPTATTLANGQYFDRYIDTATPYIGQQVAVPNPSVTSIFADTANLSLSAQAGIPVNSGLGCSYSITGGSTIPCHYSGPNGDYFLNNNWLPFMAWLTSSTTGGVNLYDVGSNLGVLHLLDANLAGPSGWWPAMQLGIDATGTNNSFNLGFGLAGSGSSSNYFSVNAYGSGLYKFYADGEFIPPGITPSTSPTCFNGTSFGGLTNVGCTGPAAAFSAITSGTNTTAAMVVGSGASLAPTGTGTIQATNISGTVSAGAGASVTGSGTTASPYVVAVTGSGPASAVSITVANAGTTGTTLNTITKLTGAPSTAVIAATTDTGGAIGITTAGAGTTGSATVQLDGLVNCVFPGATTAGDYVQISSGTAGNCADAGATYPTSGQVIGRVLSTNAAGGTYQINLFPAEIKAASSGGSGAWTNITASVTPTGCSTSSGHCDVSGTTTTAVSFASIPAHNRLQIVVYGQSSADAGLKMTFNGDTATNYALGGYFIQGSGAVTNNVFPSATGCTIQFGTTIASQIIYDLPFYADSSFAKTMTAVSAVFDSISSGTNNWQQTTSCAWSNGAAAITSTALTLSTGHFVAGTKFMLLAQD